MWSGGHVPQMGILSIEKRNWTNELWIGCVKIRFTMMYPKYGNLNRQVDFPKHWIFGVPRFGQTRDQPIVNGGLQLGTPCLYMDIKKGSGVVFKDFDNDCTLPIHCWGWGYISWNTGPHSGGDLLRMEGANDIESTRTSSFVYDDLWRIPRLAVSITGSPVIFMSTTGSQGFVPQPNMIIYCIQTTRWSCSPRICWNCLNCLVLETRVTLPEKFAQTLVCLKQRIYLSWQNNGWIWMCFGLPTSESTRNDLKNYRGHFFCGSLSACTASFRIIWTASCWIKRRQFGNVTYTQMHSHSN